MNVEQKELEKLLSGIKDSQRRRVRYSWLSLLLPLTLGAALLGYTAYQVRTQLSFVAHLEAQKGKLATDVKTLNEEKASLVERKREVEDEILQATANLAQMRTEVEAVKRELERIQQTAVTESTRKAVERAISRLPGREAPAPSPPREEPYRFFCGPGQTVTIRVTGTGTVDMVNVVLDGGPLNPARDDSYRFTINKKPGSAIVVAISMAYSGERGGQYTITVTGCGQPQRYTVRQRGGLTEILTLRFYVQ